MRCTDCSRPILPIVVLDIDGTLGDYHGHFHRFAEQYLDRALRLHYDGTCEMHEWYDLDLALYREVKMAYRQGGMKRSMPVYAGAHELSELLTHLGVETWIATTRPFLRLDNIDPDTREWLHRNGIRYDGLIYGDDKYEQLLEIVDGKRIIAGLEDIPENVERARKLGIPITLRDNKHNRRTKLDLPRCKDLWQFQNTVVYKVKEWESKMRHPAGRNQNGI